MVRAERDPLVAAGDREDWASVDLVATGDPVPVEDRFGGSAVSDDNDGTGWQPTDPSPDASRHPPVAAGGDL